MSTIVEQGMAAYYNRDPEALRRLLEQLLAALASPVSPAASQAAGPSSDPLHTGNSSPADALAGGPGKG